MPRRQPHPLRRLPLRSALRNARGSCVRALRPTLPETCFASWMLLPSALAIGRKRFAGQLVGGNYEHAVRCWVGDIDHAQIPSAARLAKRHPGALAARTVFCGLGQDVNHLVLIDIVVVNMSYAHLRMRLPPLRAERLDRRPLR